MREINGVKITPATFQEIELGETLADRLVPYFYCNERMLILMDQSVKQVKIAFELGNRCGGTWTQIGDMMRRKRRETPDFPLMDFRVPDTIQPSTLLSYISLIESQLHPLFPASPSLYPFELRKIIHWLYHELILRLHSAGYYELHRYLQRRYYSAPTLEEEFIVEFKEFLALGKPQNNGEIPAFPVFSCNSDYLKALFAILENQIIAFETLHRDFTTLLDTFTVEIESIEAATVPEQALIAPNCYTPPQLPSFLIDKSEDMDVDVLFPDEYTFRNRELAMELREIGRKRVDLEVVSRDFRDKMMKKRWFAGWKEGIWGENREKREIADKYYRKNVFSKVIFSWKSGKSDKISGFISENFASTHLLQKSIHSFQLYLKERQNDQQQFTQIYRKHRKSTLSAHFLAWKASLSPNVNPAHTAPSRSKSPSLMCELDSLMNRLKSTESKLESQLMRWKGKGGKKGSGRGKSLAQQQTKLHRTIKEMSAGKSKVGV